MGQVQFLLISEWQVSVPHQPWNYSSKTITDSHRNQEVPHFLDTTKPPSHGPWFLTPECNLPMACVACGVFFPWAVVYVTNKLLISPVQCWVLFLWWSPWPKARNPFLTNGVNKRLLKQIVKTLYELIPVKLLKQCHIIYYMCLLLLELCNTKFIKFSVTSQSV